MKNQTLRIFPIGYEKTRYHILEQIYCNILKNKIKDLHFWVLRTSSTKHVVFKWKDSNSNTNNFRFEFCEQNFKLLIFLYEIKEKYVNTLQKKER